MKHHLPFESPSQCAAGKVGSKLSSVGATFPVHHHKNVMNGEAGGWGGQCDSGREETGKECDLKCSGNYTVAMDCQLYKVMTAFIRSSLWGTQWHDDLPSGGRCNSLPPTRLTLPTMVVCFNAYYNVYFGCPPPHPPTHNRSRDRRR